MRLEEHEKGFVDPFWLISDDTVCQVSHANIEKLTCPRTDSLSVRCENTELDHPESECFVGDHTIEHFLRGGYHCGPVQFGPPLPPRSTGRACPNCGAPEVARWSGVECSDRLGCGWWFCA